VTWVLSRHGSCQHAEAEHAAMSNMLYLHTAIPVSGLLLSSMQT
jgi:hypothetical protein